MHPKVILTVDGSPVAGAFYERLISLTVTDKEGIKSDTFSAKLNDGPPNFLALPRKGAIAIPSLGYDETGVREMGRFTVDQVNVECLPYGLDINGKAADLRSGKLKEPKERHWDDKTLGDVVKEVAKGAGLEAKIADTLASREQSWVGQEDESDIHFLERLAQRNNAIFTVKDGKLIFVEKGKGESASGIVLPALTITANMVVIGSLRFEYNDRTKFKKVVAYYQDKKKAERVEVKVDADKDGESVYRIPEAFRDPAEADNAAKSKAKQLERNESSVSVTVEGNNSIVAGMPIVFAGIRPGLDGVPYMIDTATHTYTKSGYTTQISAKIKNGAGSSARAGSSGAVLDSDGDAFVLDQGTLG